jgi:hypothetical protein
MDLSKLSQKNQQELEKFWNWMERTDRARIFSFETSGNTLYSLFDSDPISAGETSMIRVLNEKIESYRLVDEKTKRFFKEESYPKDWIGDNPELYNCYQMFKILWLARDIKSRDRQEAPIQLIQMGRNYHCHPGSDKKYVITLLQPLASVRGFYIWYPELDPAPWIWTQPYEEVKSPEEFIAMFDRADHNTFTLEHGTVTFTHDEFQCQTHFEPFANGAHKACKKYGKIRNNNFHLELEHLSYKDAVHRMGMFENRNFIDDIFFENEDVFRLGDFKFLKINGIWTPEKFINAPASLIDTEWKHDPDRAIFFNNTKPNIGLHRLGQ